MSKESKIKRSNIDVMLPTRCDTVRWNLRGHKGDYALVEQVFCERVKKKEKVTSWFDSTTRHFSSLKNAILYSVEYELCRDHAGSLNDIWEGLNDIEKMVGNWLEEFDNDNSR